MLHEVGDEGNVHSSIRGISPQAGGATRPRSSAQLCALQRRALGRTDGFPDLRRSEVVAAWQRDPGFHEFREILEVKGCGR